MGARLGVVNPHHRALMATRTRTRWGCISGKLGDVLGVHLRYTLMVCSHELIGIRDAVGFVSLVGEDELIRD